MPKLIFSSLLLYIVTQLPELSTIPVPVLLLQLACVHPLVFADERMWLLSRMTFVPSTVTRVAPVLWIVRPFTIHLLPGTFNDVSVGMAPVSAAIVIKSEFAVLKLTDP